MLEYSTGNIENLTNTFEKYSQVLQIRDFHIGINTSPDIKNISQGEEVGDQTIREIAGSTWTGVTYVSIDGSNTGNFSTSPTGPGLLFKTNAGSYDQIGNYQKIDDNTTYDLNPATGTISYAVGIWGSWNTAGTFNYHYYAYPNIAGGDAVGIQVTVTSSNTAPTASNGSSSGNEDTTITGSLSTYASDAQNNISLYSIVDQPTNGTLTLDTATGAFSFTPNTNWNGQTTFIWRAKDSGELFSFAATQTITVNSVDDPLVWSSGVPGDQSWASPGTNIYSFNAGATDADSSITYSIVSGVPAWMSGSVSGSTISFSGNPSTAEAGGSATITVRASSGGTPIDKSFTISFGSAAAVNDVPTTSNNAKSGNEDANITFASSDFPFADGDARGAYTLTGIKIISLPSNGTLKLSSADVTANQAIAVGNIGNLTFTPTANYNGSASFQYQVTDGSSSYSSSATMSLTVNAVNDAPVLTGAGSDMTGLTEDATTDALNPGQAVSALLATVNDVDTTIGSTTHGSTNGRLAGIAIYSTTVGGPSTGGKWQYKVDSGTWTDVDAVTDATALLLKSTDLVRFVPDGKNGQTASFDYYAWDQATGSAGSKVSVATRGGTTAFSSGSDAVAITVSDVNDAPTIAKPGTTQTVAEDASVGITGISFGDVDIVDRNDSDTTNDVMSVTLSVAHGTITLAGVAGITFISGSGSTNASMTIEGTRGALNSAVATLNYAPTANYNGPDTLSISVDDKGNVGTGNALTTTDSVAITVTAVNDAPVLVAGGADMTGVTEDLTTNSGQLVSSILATITDTDTTIGSSTQATNNGVAQGIAIYSTTVNGPSAGGHWEYKVDSGSWTGISTVTGTSALLLKSTDLVRFVPDAKNGQTASFDYYAWDQSASTTAGTKVDVSTRGTTTAFSTASDAVAITVDDVNDAPTIATPVAQTVLEDNTLSITTLSFNDVDISNRTDGNTANDVVEITLSVAHGVLTLSGTSGITFQGGSANGTASLTFQGTLTDVNTAVSGLQYTPTLNWNRYDGATDVNDVLNVGISDLGNVRGTGDAASAALTASSTVAITVNPVNDAPVLQNAGTSAPVLVTIDENAAGNSGNLISTLVRAVDGTNPTDNTKSVVIDVDFATQGTSNGTPNEAWDGGVAVYALTNTGPADASPGHWEFKLASGSWTTIDTTQVNGGNTALLLSSVDSIRFVPDADNATTATFSYYVWDGSVGASTGGQGSYVSVATRGGTSNYSSAGDVATLTVTPVNDAPTLDLDGNDSSTASGNNFKTTFLPRGSEVAVVDTDITISDVDQTSRTDVAQQDRISQAVVTISGGDADNYPGLTDETLTFKDAGTTTASWSGLTITGNGGKTVTITGVADWATYQTALQKVVYNNANLNPTTGDRSITVVVTDNDDTDALAAHTNKLPSATATTTVNVAAIAVVDMNGNLTGANNTVTYTEGDSGKALATTDGRIDNLGGTNLKTVVLTLSNPLDGSAGNAESLFVDAATITSLASARGITVTSSNAGHTITLSATNLGVGVTANNMNVALRAVQYKNTSEAPSVTDRVVNVTVEDITMAGVGAKSTITVVPTNDAPVISSGGVAATLLEGGLAVLGIANINATDIDDAQSTLDFVVTTAPTKGVLFRDGNGNNQADAGEVLAAAAGTGVITSFTQGDLAAGLVKYQQTDTLIGSATDYVSDSFAFKVQDGMENGVTAPAGTLTLNITAVNDAPTLTATSGPVTFAETPGTAVALFSGSAISAVESAQTIGEIKLTVAGLADGAAEKLVIDGVAVALQAAGTTAITGGGIGAVSYAVAISGTTATVTLTHAGLTPTQAQALVDSLAYQNTSSAPTTSNRTVTLTSVKDSGGTANGGVDTTALSVASTVTLTATDSAPVLATNTGDNLANGGLATLTTSKLSTTDSDTAATALVYTVGTAPTKGTLFKDLNASGTAEAGEALSATSTFTQADIAAGLIKYRHSGADNTADSFSFTVKDGTTTLTSATFAFTFSAAGTVAGTGSTTASSTSGSDALFSGVAITPTPDHTIKTLTFAVTGVKDGNKEVLSVNGQNLLMQNSTTTVGDLTYTVTEAPAGSGNFTVAVTDSTAPGFSGADASALVNGVRYSNTAVPPTAGNRSVTLDGFTEMDAAGTASTPTDTNLVATTAVTLATDLFTLAAAQTAIVAPTTPNDVIQTLTFAVGGVLNGANEVFKINGVEVPLVPGATTVDGVTYTVSGTAPAMTVAVYKPAGFTETQAEALVDGATLSNTASPASAGPRTVTLSSVTEANSSALVGGVPTPATTATTVTGLSTSTSTAASGTAVSPLAGKGIPNIDETTQTIDTLTFTVSGVKDGANEVLAIGGTNVPLVPGNYPSTGATPGSFNVAVDANGKATVVFTPTTNLSEGDASALVAGVTYTNSATPATAGTRDVALTNMGVDNGSTVTGTPVTTVTSAPIVLNGVTVPTLTPGAGTDLFNAVDLPTVAAGSSVKAITLGITGVQDGAKETIKINGQTIPLVDGTSVTVDGVTYVVALDASGNGTLTATDTTAPGWNEAQAENILNNIGYQNTANPPTGGSRAIVVNEVAQASNTDWATETALTPLPGSVSTANTVAVTAPVTATPAGQSDQLFSAVNLPTPTAGSTVSELTFTVTNVKDGSNEVFTVNGQNIPLVPGSTTVDGVVYTVAVDANGTATITVADSTVPGFTEAKAESIVNGAAYTNTASPATAGDRVVTLTGEKEMTTLGVETAVNLSGAAPTPVTVAVTGTTPTSPSGTAATDLFTLTQAQAAIPTPATNYDIQTLTFAVTGIKDGASEVLKINGQSIPMVAGTTGPDANGVSYTVVDNGSGNFTVTVTDATAPAFSEAQAEALVDGASLSNTAATPTAGNRTVSLTSVTEALIADGTVGATQPITGATATVSSSGTGTVNTPMAGETLAVTSGSSVDSLTFTVKGVKDGASEVLNVNGQAVPLVATTTPPGPITDANGNTYTVTVDANGTATVTVDTPNAPTANFNAATAQSIVQGVTYTNSATPPSAGPRDVALTSMVEETGDGTTAGTTSTIPQSAIGSTVAVNGAPSTDVFASSVHIPTVPGGSTVDQISFGVSGVKDGANEVVQINGQSIPLVPGTTTDANGNTYTVVVDANGNATVTMATPTPATNLSEAQANAILDGVSYTNKASPVTPGARDITVNSVVTEDSGGNTTTVPTPGLSSTVPLGTVTNTAPQFTVNTGLTVAEGQTFTLSATQLAATDAQTAAGSLAFKLAAAPAHGTLFRDSNGNGLVDAGETIAANGSFTQAELTSGKIKYRHDSSETATDQLSLTVSDGTATTTAVPFGVTVTRVNDAPTITATAANPTFTEATTPVPVALFTAATATTGDTLGTTQKLTSMTLTVSNVVDGDKEMLLVNGVNVIDLSGVTTPGTAGTVNGTDLTYTVSKSGSTTTVTLTHAGMTEAELQTLVQSFKYQNTSTDPTAGARAVNITQLVDNGGHNLPDLDTAYLSLGSTVTVSVIDTPPTLTGTGFTVLEGGSAVLTTTQLAALDTDTPLANLVYKLTTAPAAGLLYIDNNANAVNDSGDTTLALNSTFTQLDLTSNKVRYQHGGSENADPLLAFSVSDGNTSSSPVTVAVALTSVNDAPTLGGLDGDVLTYPPANAALLIDVGSNATVTDPDSNDFAGGVLRASIYFNGNASKDVLSIKNVGTAAGQINVSGANVNYGSTLIGTFTGGSSGADLVVTLNASADKAATEALIHALQFYNSEAAPTVNSRGIRISLSDGDGATSLASQVQVNIPVGGPTFLSGSGFYVSENTSLVTVMAATESDAAKLPIVYSISTAVGANNVDAAKFTIDASNGTLSFIAAPDFELPTDSGGDNVYNVMVRASNKDLAYTEAALAVNVVNVANESGPAPGDTTPPVFGFATVNASTLVMTYTDAANNLDATNVPPPSAFAVSGNTVTAAVVNAAAKTVTLTLGAAVVAGAAVTVAYTDPTAGNDVAALQDAAGNDAITLTPTAVTNLTASGSTGGGSTGGGSTGGGSTGGGSTGGGSTGGGSTGGGSTGGGTTTPPAPTTQVIGVVTGGTTTTTTGANGDETSTTTGTLGTVTVVQTVTVTAAGETIHELVYIPVASGSGGTVSAVLPLLYEPAAGSDSKTTISLPSGIGFVLTGDRTPTTSGKQPNLIELIQQTVPDTDPTLGNMLSGGQSFLDHRGDNSTLWVNKLVLTAPAPLANAAAAPVIIDGASNNASSNFTGDKLEALVIDASALPKGTVIELQNVDFAVVIGDGIIVRGGNGANVVFGGAGSQNILLGADDDILYGGAGDDIVGSESGADQIFGNSGNDTLFGGSGADLLHGGSDTDVATFTGSISRYDISRDHGITIVRSLDRLDDIDTLINIETLRFDDGTYTVENALAGTLIATLYQQVLGRQAEVGGFQYWSAMYEGGQSIGHIAMSFLLSSEYATTNELEFGALALDAKVGLLYQQFLGREAEQAGLEYWMDQMSNGLSVDEVAARFVDSPELQTVYLGPVGWEFSL